MAGDVVAAYRWAEARATYERMKRELAEAEIVRISVDYCAVLDEKFLWEWRAKRAEAEREVAVAALAGALVEIDGLRDNLADAIGECRSCGNTGWRTKGHTRCKICTPWRRALEGSK